jgi:prevent-host-death family protein
MKRVGLRELKNRLSRYVREAQAGQEIQVTDRGETVAELLPPRRVRDGQDVRQRLSERARRGLVTLGAAHDPRRYRRLSRLAPSGTARRLIDEERGGR